MKRFVLVAMCVMGICNLSTAQEKIGEYYMQFFKKAYDISATVPENGEFSFYIYTQAKEKSQLTGFSLKSVNVENFKSAFASVKEKFIEWSKTAKDNNVTNFDKPFDFETKPVNVFFNYGTNWHFAFSESLESYFKVTAEGQCLIIVHIGEVTASDNDYIDSKGFYMAFVSIKELDNFLNALDVNAVLNKEKERKKTEDLFR